MLSTSSSLASPRKFRQDSSSSSVSGSDSNRSNSSSSSAGKKKKSNLLSSLRKESSSCSKLHSQKADLARLLEKRPTPVELEEKNILVDATIPTQSVPRARTGCWSLSFEKLLECETGVDFLRIFLASEQQLPCLYFLEAVKKYEQVSTPDLFRNAKHIVNTFILWDDVNTVPISERTKAEINEKYSKALSNAEIPPDFRWLFSAAKKEIVEHMDKTIYPAFLKSSAYQAGMKGHDESSNSSWRTLHSPRGKAPQPPKPTKVQKPSMDPQTRMSIFPVSLSALSKRTFNNPSPASQSTGSMPIPQASKNVCTVDEVLSWAQNLRALISSKAGLETFRAFLISEHSIENLDFYQEIFVFRKGNVEERNVLFEHLYRTYVMQKASLQVNLSGSVRSEMNDWIEKNPLDDNMERVVPLTIFDRAQAEIFDLIESDSYKRFIKSSFFQDALKNAQQEVSSAPSTSLAQSATPLTLTTLTQPAPPSSIPTTQKPEKSAESDASKSLKKMMPVESSCLYVSSIIILFDLCLRGFFFVI
eukprot:TRINITY_DN1562_c0_g1_i7.p1 TRINITY_DN1562_c0_g1~~TRINITY_DN1562_c0_g1_i7.p1  ORF type:complete len:532 (+),score=106.91 TRINITY_DN1562_c0_g1_i7:53-1648(+)